MYRRRSRRQAIVVIQEVLAAGRARAWRWLAGGRRAYGLENRPSLSLVKPHPHRHETNRGVAVPSEDDLVTSLSPAHELGELCLGGGDGDLHWRNSRPLRGLFVNESTGITRGRPACEGATPWGDRALQGRRTFVRRRVPSIHFDDGLFTQATRTERVASSFIKARTSGSLKFARTPTPCRARHALVASWRSLVSTGPSKSAR